MKHLVPALALLLAGCGLGSAPAASSTASASPATATTAPPSPSPTSTPAAAACRLPVANGDAPTDGNPTHGARGHGGFLQYPAGTFSADPASLATYVLSAHAWVPVPRAWVSPDGSHYAYPEYRSAGGAVTGIIHVVETGSGADHPVNTPAPSMPISWEAAGLYVARVIPNSDARPTGLSLLDPATGGLHQVTASGTWTLIAGASAYGADIDTSIAPPPGNGGPGGANRVSALSLPGGQATVVATYPGTNVSLLAAHGRDLVLGLITSDRYTIRVGGATIYEAPVASPQPGAPAVVDGSTIWFSGPGAVWRWAGGGPLRQFSVPGQLVMAAGACR